VADAAAVAPGAVAGHPVLESGMSRTEKRH
jgi:hypothetical protein